MGGSIRTAPLTVLMITTLLFGMSGVASAQPLHGALASGFARSVAQRVQTATSQGLRSAQRLPESRLRFRLRTPRPIIVAEAEAPSLPTRVYARAVDIVGTNIRDLPVDEARFAVRVGCAFKDGADALSEDTLAETLTSAGVSFGGNATLRLRAQGMVRDMAEAESFGDAVGQLAVAFVCEQA